ncbi:MAG: hypothetical protein SV253_07840 [Halobacteria archaeon]|nr:hypothetical protein [Halobacteria archaeon]
MKIYLDATTVISLSSINELRLLNYINGDLTIPSKVLSEVTTQPAETNLERFLGSNEDIKVERKTQLDDQDIEDACSLLGENELNGDVQIIAGVLRQLDRDQTETVVVSDDRRVRNTADSLGVSVTGTIGVVVNSVKKELPSQEGKEIIRRVDSRGLHMTGELREKAYEMVEKADSESEK